MTPPFVRRFSVLRRSGRSTSIVLAVLMATLPMASQADDDGTLPRPGRQVEGNRIASTADPAMTVTVPEAATYLGARRILVDEAFDAEIHTLAEVDPFRLVERSYRIQFEADLPDAPGRYDHAESNPETARIDGIEMYVRLGGEDTAEGEIRPGSDDAAFRGLVDEAGYRLPTWLTTQRLVRPYEPTERGEVIVVYGEDPDALAEAAATAMIAGEPGLVFAEMLPDLIADVDARVDLIRYD